MERKSNLVILILFLLSSLSLQAQVAVDSLEAHRFITRATMYGVGHTNVFDTYLSPQEYTGLEFRFARETMRQAKCVSGNTFIQNYFQAYVGYTENRAENNNTFNGLMTWNYGLFHRFRLTEHFQLLGGGMGDLNGGFIYNLRNSNNPASAKAYFNLAASGMAIWDVKIKRYPLRLRYQVLLPVAGVMFSPQYGQSYYEIFTLGNAHGIINFTSLHNQPALRQSLSVDFPVGNSTLRLGYLCDLQQSKVNDLKTHTFSHVFMVGFVKELYRLPNKKKK